MNLLKSLDLQGYKSIRELNQLEFGSLNVLIGANGAGKSNLISFFRLLNWMTFAPDQFQFYIGRVGAANSLLYDGAATTPQIRARLAIQTDAGLNEYQLRLFHAAPDTLIFAEEKFRFTRNNRDTVPPWTSLGAGHRETNLIVRANEGDTTAQTILALLKRCVVYQFHNTSETARIKQRWQIEDARNLREDGANLAAFLYRLREKQNRYYTRIVATIHQIAPFFVDFVLEPDFGTILLQWRERGSDLIFGPHQASDGTLRVMALVTLLLQPKETLPDLMILDEPELGLHPYAINVLAGLLKSASHNTQIMIATQSTMLLDYFEPEQIIVVDRPGRESIFTHLDVSKLADWLADYSLAELWEKNVIGGATGMTRLHIIVEGQTEETFVRDVLAPHLGQFDVFADARCVLTSRNKKKLYRGGLVSYEKVKKDLQDWMKEDQDLEVYFTTMFDLYALPENFPAYELADRERDPYRKVKILKHAFNQDLQHPRFIPYIQLYEFETLLFVDVQHFDWEFLEHTNEIQKLSTIAAQFDNPELINDGGETAPSKRIIKLIPEYESRKASAGPIIAGKIGLPLLREKCQHFNHWLTALEKLGTTLS